MSAYFKRYFLCNGSGFCVGDDYPFINLNGESYADDDDPASDFVDISPDGKYIVVTFRGPHPVTIGHAAVGSCAGFGAVTLNEMGTTSELTHVFRTFLSDTTGTKNPSDIHATVIWLDIYSP